MSAATPLQFTGHAWARWCLRRLGWTLLPAQLPGPRGIIVAYPHTSNWDFPIAMLAKWGLGWPLRFWAKDSLFRLPVLGAWLRWIGAVAVSRGHAKGQVGQALQTMQQEPFFWLALAPEGTRSQVPGWRLGFYHLWTQAQCPLGVGIMDWRSKTIGVKAFIYASGDMARDFEQLAAIVGPVQGHTPGREAPIVPWQRDLGQPPQNEEGKK